MPSLIAKMNFFSILARNYWKIEIELFLWGTISHENQSLSQILFKWLSVNLQTCMEYCCHVWAGAPRCYLKLLDKLQKQICRTVGASCASLEPLAYHQNVASFSLFCRYYFGRCLPELAQLIPLPYSRERFTCYSDRLHKLSISIPRCQQFLSLHRFFPCTVSFLAQTLEFSAYRMLSFDLWS